MSSTRGMYTSCSFWPHVCLCLSSGVVVVVVGICCFVLLLLLPLSSRSCSSSLRFVFSPLCLSPPLPSFSPPLSKVYTDLYYTPMRYDITLFHAYTDKMLAVFWVWFCVQPSPLQRVSFLYPLFVVIVTIDTNDDIHATATICEFSCFDGGWD